MPEPVTQPVHKSVSHSLRIYWDLLARHIRPQWPRFAILLVLMVGGIALQLVNPQIMRAFIDQALGGKPLNDLMFSAGLYIGIALLQQVFSVGTTYVGESVAWTATNALRAELAHHCLNLDMGFHNQHTPGDLIERINGDVAKMAEFFSQFAITLAGNALLLIGILVVLYIEDWRAGLAFTLYALVAVTLLVSVRNLAIQEEKQVRQASAEMMGFIEEQLSGTEDVRANGAVGYVLRELAHFQKKYFQIDIKQGWKNFFIHFGMTGILTLGFLVAILSGFFLFNAHLVTIGTVYLFVRYINLLEGPLWTLTRQMVDFQMIGACVERLMELRKLQPLVKDGPRTAYPAGALELSFDRVHFAYEVGEPVLNGLSFDLRPGSVLGLLGRTGSGKSTLARLIFRLFDPTQGTICLDGMDLRESQLAALRKRIAMVTQDVQLFRASVRDNLTFFDPSIPDQRVTEVIRELGLDDWYAALPNGLDSMLESGARGLSAGEAQLLALARVFLRDPGLVILDEASSRLDPATETRIERAIDKLLAGRSAIIIAHRLGTVQRADDILIIEDGQAFEYGPRAALAADSSSRFYRLLQTGLEEVLA
jgi:ATP-binding cassette, subfamily B, bacterial